MCTNVKLVHFYPEFCCIAICTKRTERKFGQNSTSTKRTIFGKIVQKSHKNGVKSNTVLYLSTTNLVSDGHRACLPRKLRGVVGDYLDLICIRTLQAPVDITVHPGK